MVNLWSLYSFVVSEFTTCSCHRTWEGTWENIKGTTLNMDVYCTLCHIKYPSRCIISLLDMLSKPNGSKIKRILSLFMNVWSFTMNDDKTLDVFSMIPSLISLAFLVLFALELVDITFCSKTKSNFNYVIILINM